MRAVLSAVSIHRNRTMEAIEDVTDIIAALITAEDLVLAQRTIDHGHNVRFRSLCYVA